MAAKKAKPRAKAKKTTALRKPAKSARAKKQKKSTTAKKSTARKPNTIKTVSKKISVGSKPYTKSELFSVIAETTGLTKKDVTHVFDQFCTIAFAHMKSNAKQFTIPNIGKIIVNRKPATKERKGINPFTGEPAVFKAKPARNVVKIRPLKSLKEAAK